MKRYALAGLCIAAALTAWGASRGDGDHRALGGDEPQRPGWSLPLALPDQERHVAVDATQPPEPMRQAAEGDIEQQATAGEPRGDVLNGGSPAPVTFYTCYGPNGDYCAGPAGPLPLAEGQAACGEAWPMGAILMIEGDPLGAVVCNDRGRLAPYQVDRFFWREEDGWAWSAQVGSYVRVQQVGTLPSAP